LIDTFLISGYDWLFFGRFVKMAKRKNSSEPTIKQLKEIMHEVAIEAKDKADRTNMKLKEQIKKEIILAFQRLNNGEQWS